MSTTETGYDGDSKAEERENRPLTFGGREFKPRRKIPRVMRQVRGVVREQRKLVREAEKLNPEIRIEERRDVLETQRDKLDADDKDGRQALDQQIAAIDEEIANLPDLDDETSDRLAEIEDEREDIAYKILAASIEPKSSEDTDLAGIDARADFLAEHVDIEDVNGTLESININEADEDGETDPTGPAKTPEPTAS